MSIREINQKLLSLGKGLLTKIKYELFFSYNAYDFLKLRGLKKRKAAQKLSHSLYKKKS